MYLGEFLFVFFDTWFYFNPFLCCISDLMRQELPMCSFLSYIGHFGLEKDIQYLSELLLVLLHLKLVFNLFYLVLRV